MKKIIKAYYLHTNHSLIEKQAIVFQSDPSYFSSPFVLKVWYIYENQTKEEIKSFLYDAMIKGALPLDVKKIAEEYNLSKKDIDDLWKIPR